MAGVFRGGWSAVRAAVAAVGATLIPRIVTPPVFNFSVRAGDLVNRTALAQCGFAPGLGVPPARLRHIFRPELGYVNPQTLASQARFLRLFAQVASSPQNLRPDAVQVGIITQDAANAGVQAFTWNGITGQVWVTVRNGVIQNAGVNRIGSFR